MVHREHHSAITVRYERYSASEKKGLLTTIAPLGHVLRYSRSHNPRHS